MQPVPEPEYVELTEGRSDAKSRALRTAAQNLLFDLILGLILVLYPLTQAGVDLSTVDWRLLIFSLIKTVVATAFAGIQRYIETARSVNG